MKPPAFAVNIKTQKPESAYLLLPICRVSETECIGFLKTNKQHKVGFDECIYTFYVVADGITTESLNNKTEW
jgi:hypothetical protein